MKTFLYIGVPIFLLFLAALGVRDIDTTSASYTKPTPTPEARIVAQSNGTQFAITNLDDSDCENAELIVNSKYHLDGYTLKVGETYTVGGLQFADGNNQRFNPFEEKPVSLGVICQGNNGLSFRSATILF